MSKIVHVYWGAKGNASGYLDAIYSALSLNRDYSQKLIVSVGYAYLPALKVFFPITDRLLHNPGFNHTRRIIRALEMIIGLLFTTFYILIYRPNCLNYSHVSRSYKVVSSFLRLWKLLTPSMKLLVTAHDVSPLVGARSEITVRNEIFNAADFVIVHNRMDSEELHWKFNQTIDKVLYHPFPLFKASSSYQIPLSYDLLFIGSIRKGKGLGLLYKAHQELVAEGVPLKLAICGKVDDQKIIEGIRSDSLVHTRFGYLSDAQFDSYLRQAKLICLPYTEGTNSGVLSLAFSSGRNILASDLAMFKQSGFLTKGDLFHTGDIQSLKKAIKRKLSSTYHVQNRDLDAYRITFEELVNEVYNKVL